MIYQIKGIQKIGIKAYETEMNNVISDMSKDGFKVQQLLGSPDQGVLILFSKE